MTSQHHHRQSARAARAGGGPVRPHRQRLRVADPRRRAAAGEMDGKSIMGLLLLAAAQGSVITISADGPDEADAVDGAVRARHSRFRRGAMRLTGLGVSPGIGDRQGAWCSSAARATSASGFRRRGSRASWNGLTPPGSVRANSCSRSRHESRRQRGTEHAYLFDAQLLMLDDAMLIDRRGGNHSRPSG